MFHLPPLFNETNEKISNSPIEYEAKLTIFIVFNWYFQHCKLLLNSNKVSIKYFYCGLWAAYSELLYFRQMSKL